MMNPKLMELVRAIWVSRKFTKFFESTPCVLPDGHSFDVKITKTKRSERQVGYRFAAHSMMVKAETSTGLTAYGYGESDVEFLALQKGIAEAVERCVFKSVVRNATQAQSSNGWAAHLTLERARRSAKGELMERDAVLLHWLSQTPLQQIRLTTLPAPIRSWLRGELSLAPRFNKAKFFMSSLGGAPAASVMLYDDLGYGFISHSASQTLLGAIERAMSEVCRIADFAGKGIMRSSGELLAKPDDHALYYADMEKFPAWLDMGASVSFEDAEAVWKEKLSESETVLDFEFEEFSCGPLSVVQCKSRSVQNLFFGSSLAAKNAGLINLERLKKVSGAVSIYTMPHFVP